MNELFRRLAAASAVLLMYMGAVVMLADQGAPETLTAALRLDR
jgi:hypothetical protein